VSRFALVPLVFAAACGGSGSLCEKWADEIEACDEDDDFSIEECEEQLENCDGADRDLLDEFYTCASDAGLFECETDGTTDMTAALEKIGAAFACMEPLEDLSEECQGEVMTGSTGAAL